MRRPEPAKLSNETGQKSAVVTGVSTGIGRAIAAALVAGGWRVFGSVRKAADGDAAKQDLGASFTPLIFDVTDADAIARGAQTVRAALGGQTLDALVNNAGVGVGGPLAYLKIDELKRQMDVNLYGPLRVTQAFLPQLGADKSLTGKPGRIVNMSSVGGRIAAPFAVPYAMSKHALEAFSDGLRRELVIHGIDVITIGPGAIKTPIWDKAEDFGLEQYAHTEYAGILKRMQKAMRDVGDAGLPPEAVGDLVRHVLTAPKPKARYAILKGKFMNWTLPNLLPKRMVDKAVARRFGLKPARR